MAVTRTVLLRLSTVTVPGRRRRAAVTPGPSRSQSHVSRVTVCQYYYVTCSQWGWRQAQPALQPSTQPLAGGQAAP
jgi:hypothetical protein